MPQGAPRLHMEGLQVRRNYAPMHIKLVMFHSHRSAILYLNGEFEGGKFFFAHSPKDLSPEVSGLCEKLSVRSLNSQVTR